MDRIWRGGVIVDYAIMAEEINGGDVMPWKCFIVEDSTHADRAGAVWPEYNERDNKTDWYVRLPNGGIHNIHAKTQDGTGWNVTGEAPNFTVTPSINRYPNINRNTGEVRIKGWHGYITDGVLSDDYDGRVYDDDSDTR